MLLQIDGSQHDWLQGRGPHFTLVGAIDDATGKVPFALFRQHEDTHGYLLMLKNIIERHGVPLALYSDRHGIFQHSPKEPQTLEEQLRGRRDPTQFGRALEELGIELILAYTPQAKGRIERAWGTFQDRLVSEMRLAGAATIDQANEVLSEFLPRFNARFPVDPAQPGSVYRQLPDRMSLDSVLCFKYIRSVANDNTVQFNHATLQLLPGEYRASYARAKVEVQERLDGSLVVVHQGKTLAAVPAPPHTGHYQSTQRPSFQWAHHSQRSFPTPCTFCATGRRAEGTENRRPSPDNGQDQAAKEASPRPPLKKKATDIIIEHTD